MKYLFIYIYKYVCIYKCLIVLWVYKYIIYMIIVDCVSSLLSHDRCITMRVGMNMLLICGILIILSTRKLLIYIQPLYCHTRTITVLLELPYDVLCSLVALQITSRGYEDTFHLYWHFLVVSLIFRIMPCKCMDWLSKSHFNDIFNIGIWRDNTFFYKRFTA